MNREEPHVHPFGRNEHRSDGSRRGVGRRLTAQGPRGVPLSVGPSWLRPRGQEQTWSAEIVKIAGLLTALALSFSSVPVMASTREIRDPDDVKGTLDIAKVSHGHGRTDDVLQHRITMHDPWRSRALSHWRSIITIWFSTDDEDRFGERRVMVNYRNQKLTAYA